MSKVRNPFDGKTLEQIQASVQKGIETRRRNAAKRREQEDLTKQKALDLKYKIAELESRLNELQELEQFGGQLNRLTGKTLMPESMIVESSFPYSDMSGIYFLIKDGEVVYIGQSVSIFARIAEHRKSKDFDSINWIPCKKEMLDKMESLYIHFIQPPLNGRHVNGVPHAPINIDSLLG